MAWRSCSAPGQRLPVAGAFEVGGGAWSVVSTRLIGVAGGCVRLCFFGLSVGWSVGRSSALVGLAGWAPEFVAGFALL
jgi:hypothetical protein